MKVGLFIHWVHSVLHQLFWIQTKYEYGGLLFRSLDDIHNVLVVDRDTLSGCVELFLEVLHNTYYKMHATYSKHSMNICGVAECGSVVVEDTLSGWVKLFLEGLHNDAASSNCFYAIMWNGSVWFSLHWIVQHGSKTSICTYPLDV